MTNVSRRDRSDTTRILCCSFLVENALVILEGISLTQLQSRIFRYQADYYQSNDLDSPAMIAVTIAPMKTNLFVTFCTFYLRTSYEIWALISHCKSKIMPTVEVMAWMLIYIQQKNCALRSITFGNILSFQVTKVIYWNLTLNNESWLAVLYITTLITQQCNVSLFLNISHLHYTGLYIIGWPTTIPTMEIMCALDYYHRQIGSKS